MQDVVRRKEKLNKMQMKYMNSIQPIKDVLLAYNTASVRGFDSELVANTLS